MLKLLLLTTLLIPMKLTAQPADMSPLRVEAIISFYTDIDSCHHKGCLNASGRKPQFGDTACPRAIPLNTIVHIQGEDYVCADRTAKWVDGRYDIFLGYGEEKHKQAKRMGIFKTDVEVYL